MRGERLISQARLTVDLGAPFGVPLRRHEPSEIEAGEGFRNKCARLSGGPYIGKGREPAGRRRYDGGGNIPTLTTQRVGRAAAWVGLRASFRVAPMRCAESGTYRSFKDGPPAVCTHQPAEHFSRLQRRHFGLLS